MDELAHRVADLLTRVVDAEPHLLDEPDALRAVLESGLGPDGAEASPHLDALMVVAIDRMAGSDSAEVDPSVLERWERLAPGWLPWASSVWDAATRDLDAAGAPARHRHAGSGAAATTPTELEVVVERSVPERSPTRRSAGEEDRVDAAFGPRASLGAGALLLFVAALTAAMTFGLLRDDGSATAGGAPPTTATTLASTTTTVPAPPPEIGQPEGPDVLTGGVETTYTVTHDGASAVVWQLTVDEQTVEIGTGDSVSFACATRPDPYEVLLAVEGERDGAVARSERALPCIPPPTGTVDPTAAELVVAEEVVVTVAPATEETWRLVVAGGDAALAGSDNEIRFSCAGATRPGVEGTPVTYVEVYLAPTDRAAAQLAASVEGVAPESIDRPTGSVTRNFEVVFANAAGVESRQSLDVTCAAPPPPPPPPEDDPAPPAPEPSGD
ncbi:MAG: hypothetical protein JJU45_03275 [Acidimicrobiia bacterium]|nr:hypothetical protein [Acidimicrobiia bacterium]